MMLADNIRTIDTRYGREMAYYADDLYIGRSLEIYGEYSELEAELWRKLLRPGDVAVDVGANIGALTLALANIVGDAGHVIAVEPQPESASLLARNVEGKDNIKVLACALGAESSATKMPSLAAVVHKNYGGVSIGAGDLDVKVTALDSCSFERVDFVKIDVEGHELQVLAGARQTIAACRPILYIESHPDQSGQDLLRAVRLLGYRVFEHNPPLFNPRNWRGYGLNEFDNIVSFNILCIPTEKISEYRHVTDALQPIIPARPTCGKSEWVGIARLGGVGDNLIAASVLRPLKKMGFKVDVVTSLPQGVVFENNTYIDKLSFQRDLPQNHADWQRWFYSRGLEYERFVPLSHTCEYALGFLQHQTAYQWPPATRRKLADHSYLEYVCDIVGVPYDFGPLFFPTDEEREFAIATRRKYCGDAPLVGWCITGSRADKVYPQSAHVIGRLIKEAGVHVALLGAPPPHRDLEYANAIVEDVRRTVSDVSSLHVAMSPSMDNETWHIRRLLTFALNCDLVIGPDTGPMWAVAMERMPKIVLLSHASPKNIITHWVNSIPLYAGPQVLCWPCHLLIDAPADCIEERRRCGMKIPPDADKLGAACISSIAVETVVRTAISLLKKEH